MSDELSLRRSTDRGARAKALLESDILAEAFTSLEKEYIGVWKASQTRDTDGRERIWTALTILTRVRDHLTTMVTNGRVAQAELDQIAAASPKKRA